jgi:hypothetical protein
VLPRKRQRGGGNAPNADDAAEQPKSKSELRKLKQIERKKESQARLAGAQHVVSLTL